MFKKLINEGNGKTKVKICHCHDAALRLVSLVTAVNLNLKKYKFLKSIGKKMQLFEG